MYRLNKLLGLLVIVFILTSCSYSSEKVSGNNSKQASDSTEKEVSIQALAYVKALQNEDYKKAYEMLSSVYKDAGVSIENLKYDLQNSNLNLNGYNVKVTSMRERLPDEKSKTNKAEPFYLVSFNFESKGQTREDYSRFTGSDVKWVNERIWFQRENGKWKFFATQDQEGVTWKPDAYGSVLKYVQDLEDNDTTAIFSTFSDYYKQQGETVEDIKNQLKTSNGKIISYDIKKITDDLNIQEDDKVLSPQLYADFVRVKGSYYKENYSGFDEPGKFDFEWYFHLEDGKWKYLTDDFYNVRNYDMHSFLENPNREDQNDIKKEDSSSKDINSNKNIINKITNIKGKHVLLGEKYDEVLDLLGEPDEKHDDGEEVDLTYGNVILNFSAIDNSPGDYENQLKEIQRKDIFNSKQEVLSLLGETDNVDNIEELNEIRMKYLIDDYLLSVYLTEDNNISYISLTNNYD